MGIHWEEACEKLRLWREDTSRYSADIVELWLNSLESQRKRLKDEEWMVLEQVFIAALDCGQTDVANSCFLALNQQFPGSLRVLKLKGMRFEALERYEDAIAVYDLIIKEDETNSGARKRKVAVFKSQGRTQEAIKELNDYLTKFMSDGEAWQELCDLYLKEGEYTKAAYCIEERLLMNPHNHLFQTRFAEIKYTQGGTENIEIARQYFAMAAKINPKYMRALYGIMLCCSNAFSSGKLTSAKKKELQKLSEWAEKQISQGYSEAKGKGLKISRLQDAFSVLSISEKIMTH